MNAVSMRALLAMVVATITVACTSAGGDEATSSDSALSDDVDKAIQTDLPSTCAFAAVLEQAGEPKCKDETLLGVCSQAKPTLAASVESLLASPLATKLAREDGDRAELTQSISLDFRDAMDNCIRGQEHRTEQQRERIANDPDLQARVKAGQDRFWHATTRAIARTVIRGATPLNGGRALASVRKMFLWGACSAGSQVVSDFMSSHDHNPSDDGCTAIFRFDNERWSRCVASAGSICSGMGGFVDLSKWPGLTTENELANWIEDAASVGLEALCKAGGPVSSTACGFINAAANQIAEALKTGTNDWAECSGTSAIGVCIGTWWGSGGWTNDEGVETARREQGADGQGWWARGCCKCERVQWVRDQGWVVSTDHELERENWTGVIQKGDFATGNCQQKMGQEFVDDLNPSYWDPQRSFHTYEACERVDVVGDRCALVQDGHDATLQLWDNEAKRPSGEVLRRH